MDYVRGHSNSAEDLLVVGGCLGLYTCIKRVNLVGVVVIVVVRRLFVM